MNRTTINVENTNIITHKVFELLKDISAWCATQDIENVGVAVEEILGKNIVIVTGKNNRNLQITINDFDNLEFDLIHAHNPDIKINCIEATNPLNTMLEMILL